MHHVRLRLRGVRGRPRPGHEDARMQRLRRAPGRGVHGTWCVARRGWVRRRDAIQRRGIDAHARRGRHARGGACGPWRRARAGAARRKAGVHEPDRVVQGPGDRRDAGGGPRAGRRGGRGGLVRQRGGVRLGVLGSRRYQGAHIRPSDGTGGQAEADQGIRRGGALDRGASGGRDRSGGGVQQ